LWQAIIAIQGALYTFPVNALAEVGLREGRLMAVGGAPVTQRNADEWGADLYAADAGAAVRVVNEALAKR